MTIDPLEAVSKLRELGYDYFVGAFSNIDENYCVYAYHIVGYKNKPTQADLSSLKDELASEEELGMTNMKFNEDFFLMEFDESYFV